jgi:hypothetical protein
MFGQKEAASSSSRESELTITDLVERALEIIRSESPPHASGVRAALEGSTIGVVLDDERFVARASDDSVIVDRGAMTGDVEIATSIRELLALLEGRAALVDALSEGRIRIRGRVQDLSRAARAMRWFLHGLVRSRNGAELLIELRRLARRSGDDGVW